MCRLKIKGIKENFMKNKRKALIIGIDDYPLKPLEGCVNDAKEVNDLLSRNEDKSKNFETVFIPNIIQKSQLKLAISELFKNDDDIALLYFAGHGTYDETDGYLVTPDGAPAYPGVRFAEIMDIVTNSKCSNKIIILDSCFSGKCGDKSIIGFNSAIGQGVTILSACRTAETAAETTIKKADGTYEERGLFTSLFCEALKGGAADLFGEITPGSVYAYIDKALGRWKQRPLFKTNVQEFVSLRTVNPPIALTDLQELKQIFVEKNSEYPLDPSYECTNNPSLVPTLVEPYTIEENVKILKLLQRYERVGLVEPVGEVHMYDAAMKSKSCRLTQLGQYYWSLAKKELF